MRVRSVARQGQPALARGSAAILAGLVAVACGDEDRPAPLSNERVPAKVTGCEGYSYRSCDIAAPSCQAEVFGLMACLRGEAGDNAPSPPPVNMLTEAEAMALVLDESTTAEAEAASAEESEPGDFAGEVRGLELLGLLEAGLIRDEVDVVDVSVGSMLAFYLTTTREVYIIDRGEPLDGDSANATLAHEFVHALQDTRHDLDVFSDVFALDTDSSLAIASVVEGEASFYEYLMRFAYEGTAVEEVDFERLFGAMTGLADDLTLEAGSPIITARGIFPYTYGTRYAGLRWLSGDTAALDELYVEPPRSTRDVMEVVAGPLVGGVPAPEPPDNQIPVMDDVAGAWVVSAVAAQISADADRSVLAPGWSGDHFWVYRNAEDQAVTSLWSVAWSDTNAASRFADLLRGWAPDGASSRVLAAGDVTHVVVSDSPADLEAWVERLTASPL